MKRILSFLVVSILAVLMSVNVFAADATVYITPASSTVAPGGTITFTISISGTYDGYSIDIPKSGNGYSVLNVLSTANGTNADDLGDRWCVSIMPGQDIVNSNATSIATVTVSVSSTASGSIQLTLSEVIVANNFGDMADFSLSNGSVTVQSQSSTQHTHSSSKWEINEEMHWHKCTCGENYDYANHSYDDGLVTKSATCTQKGELVYTCTVCEYKSVLTLEASHTAGEWETLQESTCTEQGKEQRKCKICGQVIEERATEKLSHNFGEWNVAKEPTTNERGVEERLCSSCGIKESREIPKLDSITVTTGNEPEVDVTYTITNQTYVTDEPEDTDSENSEPAVTTAPDASEEITTTLPEDEETPNVSSSANDANDTDNDNVTPLIVILIVVVVLAATGMIVLVTKRR